MGYVISTLDAGGAERQLLNVVNALPEAIQPRIFVLRRRLELLHQLTNARAQVRTIGLSSRGDLPGWLRLARALREEKVDVLHSHMLLSNLASRMLRYPSGPRLVINHEHGLSAWKGRVLNEIDWVTHRFADKIIVVSEASRQVRLRRARLDPGRVVVMHNSIDWASHASVPPAPKGRAGNTWGIAARLVPIKRIELALQLLAKARESGSASELVIAGDGPEREKLVFECRRLGLEGAVKFLGQVDDMLGFYARVDVVLLTSLSEDCPMTVLEGLAAGKFVAATAVGGVPELLTGAHDSQLIEESEDLTQAARRLAQVPVGFVSHANREYARRFDTAPYVQKLIRLYNERG